MQLQATFLSRSGTQGPEEVRGERQEAERKVGAMTRMTRMTRVTLLTLLPSSCPHPKKIEAQVSKAGLRRSGLGGAGACAHGC